MNKIEYLKFFTLIVCAFCICESIILSAIGLLKQELDSKILKRLYLKSTIFLIIGILSYILYKQIK
jgi:hypothetical protein